MIQTGVNDDESVLLSSDSLSSSSASSSSPASSSSADSKKGSSELVDPVPLRLFFVGAATSATSSALRLRSW